MSKNIERLYNLLINYKYIKVFTITITNIFFKKK